MKAFFTASAAVLASLSSSAMAAVPAAFDAACCAIGVCCGAGCC